MFICVLCCNNPSSIIDLWVRATQTQDAWSYVFNCYVCFFFEKKNITNLKLCKILFCGFSVKIIVKFSIDLRHNCRQERTDFDKYRKILIFQKQWDDAAPQLMHFFSSQYKWLFLGFLNLIMCILGGKVWRLNWGTGSNGKYISANFFCKTAKTRQNFTKASNRIR